MIVRAAPPLRPDEAARRASSGRDPVWLSSPGAATGSDDNSAITRDVVAADPVTVVRGDSVAALEQAWTESRRAWRGRGEAVVSAELPVAVGWISYDLARQWMRLQGRPQPRREAEGEAPLLEFRIFDALWIRDTDGTEARIVATDEGAAARLEARLNRPPRRLAPPVLEPMTSAVSGMEARAAHAAAVGKIKDYLFAGDAYQVNLARRMTARISDGDPLWMAATLRAQTPAPYAIWMGGRPESARQTTPGTADVGLDAPGPIDRYLVGNSPERFLRVDVEGRVETRPIKGTRPRGSDAATDAAARAALACSAKDRAEHVMIVDLERNDLGRVCQTGTVVVEDLLRILELPTVFHLVSTVRGRLRRDVGLSQLLEATFPGGSITGAPKRRAMEIIDELEPFRRGIYTGATGWLGAAGDLDLAVAIRTATVAEGVASLSVGGGIVADSDAAAEWEETEIKARAFSELCRAPAGRRPFTVR